MADWPQHANVIQHEPGNMNLEPRGRLAASTAFDEGIKFAVIEVTPEVEPSSFRQRLRGA